MHRVNNNYQAALEVPWQLYIHRPLCIIDATLFPCWKHQLLSWRLTLRCCQCIMNDKVASVHMAMPMIKRESCVSKEAFNVYMLAIEEAMQAFWLHCDSFGYGVAKMVYFIQYDFYSLLLLCCLQCCPYLCTRNTQIPLRELIIARIVNDQPLPMWSIKVGATSGVQPAETHLIRLAALITDAECFW